MAYTMKPYFFPPDTRADGTGNPPIDMDGIVDALIAMGIPYNVMNAVYGNADPTGATDSTAVLQAAMAALPAGMPLPLPPGATFLVSAPIEVTPWNSLVGAGAVLNNSFLSDYPTTFKVAAGFTQGSCPVNAAIAVLDETAGGYSISSAGQQLVNINVDGSAGPASVDAVDVYGGVGGVLMRDVSVVSATGGGFNFLSRAGSIPDGLRLTGLMAARSTGNNFFFQAADAVCHDLHAIGSNAGDGFRIITCANSHFSDCRSGNNAEHGWNFGNGTGSADPTGYLSLQNCNSQLNTEDGYYVDWTSGNGGHVLNMSGCTSIGDGNNSGAGGGSFGALTVAQSTAPIVMDNFIVISSVATGNCPQYAVKATNCAYLLIRSGFLCGYSTVFLDGGGNGRIYIDPGVLQATGAPTAPTYNALTGVGGLQLVATTGQTGVALTNGTPSILSWTAPNDGNVHTVHVVMSQHVTSSETGGAIGVATTDPSGTVVTPQLFAGGSGTGSTGASTDRVVKANTTVTVEQTSALSGGAATVWAEIWAS